MLLFESTLASAGGALILTVTCDSEFAGQTITCTDGTTTLTQTCPSSSPYTVEFKIPNAGIWTISSGIDSVTVTITDTATLHHIPTGSTVTPTDDIQTWLNCGEIWDKNYTTISEVLNDATTLTTLIASANAVDYMVRSTTWATDVCADSTAMSLIGLDNYCAETLLADSTWQTAIVDSTYFDQVLTKKVPTMTSDTTPSGLAFAGNNGTNAYKAFDGSTATSWAASNNVLSYIGYKFTEATRIYKVVAYSGNSNQINYNVKYDDTGSSSTVVPNSNFSVGGSYANRYIHVNISEENPHLYWSVAATSGASGATSSMAELQFYGR